ncbi:MAG: hypothetical protein B7C24_17035 [Bacteroidetes bacterium 4572_77]|nr:MAG: hypothetical protein B7C24_17035 [Bacteroidetes bacterium 4572_77]
MVQLFKVQGSRFKVSFGQSKWVKKSEKLYLKGNYEKCISKTKKYMLKERRSADLQYFIVQSNLALSKQQQGTRRISYLRKTISSWEKLERYNKDHKDYSLLEKELLESLNSELLAMDIGSRKGDYFHNKLAEVFGDTSQRYCDIHQIKIVAKEVEVVIPLDTRFKDLSEERMEIIKAAKNAVGGFDCSGFTQYVYQSAGIELPHNANMQSKMGDTIDIREAQPGDLILIELFMQA